MSVERVTYRPEGASRARTIFLEDARVVDWYFGPVLTGIQVDRFGDEVAPKGVDERRHLISLGLITARVPVVMDRTYGVYVDA